MYPYCVKGHYGHGCILQMVCGLLCAVVVMARGARDSEQQRPADASWTPAQYDFNYAVNDPLTGDLKDQRETRAGDDVAGFYRTLDADGLVRTVRYQADAVNGFRAEVVREPVPDGGMADLATRETIGVPAAYHRGSSSAYPFAAAAGTAAYWPYQPYQPYQPYLSRARLLQPYSPYAVVAAYRPYPPYPQPSHGLRLQAARE